MRTCAAHCRREGDGTGQTPNQRGLYSRVLPRNVLEINKKMIEDVYQLWQASMSVSHLSVTCFVSPTTRKMMQHHYLSLKSIHHHSLHPLLHSIASLHLDCFAPPYQPRPSTAASSSAMGGLLAGPSGAASEWFRTREVLFVIGT